MPKMGDAMEEGTLREWLKKEGEPVAEQEPIATIETEKSTIEIPSFYTGQIVRILVQPGETVPVGTPIAVIDTGEEEAAGERAAEPKAAEPAKKETAAPAGETPQLEASRAPARPSPTDGGARVKASPLARKVAAQRGVDLTQVRGTGPGGRIVEADVEEFLRTRGAPAEAPPREAPAEVVPSERAPRPAAPRPLGDGAFTERELSTMRRTIARRLVESKQQIPHYYVTSAIDMGAVAKLRDQINDLRGDQPKVTYNDFITRACALALKQFPTVNAQFVDGKLREFSGAHIGVAVALPEGLIVPVVRDADRKSLSQISDEIRTLAERARAGQLKPEEYSGGTFTVSNLGMFDVEDFIGVINPPEVALLAVGAVREEPVVKGGQVAVGLRMRVTLSADHRIIDGAVAAQFLQAVKRYLQEPLLLM